MSFDAEVRASGRGSHALVVPNATVASLGSRRVRVRIGGETFEATLGSYGGRTFLGLRKPVLTALGVVAGDEVHVELEPLALPDPEPAAPELTICPELETAVADDLTFAERWRALPETHRLEYGRWISGSEDAQTRGTRLARLRHRLMRT